ncbi:MAG: hypothetical protein Q9170_007976, partial [Blastenia crenularia]
MTEKPTHETSPILPPPYQSLPHTDLDEIERTVSGDHSYEPEVLLACHEAVEAVQEKPDHDTEANASDPPSTRNRAQSMRS